MYVSRAGHFLSPTIFRLQDLVEPGKRCMYMPEIHGWAKMTACAIAVKVCLINYLKYTSSNPSNITS